MENGEKKYGGCLGILLPLWILGQIISIFFNFTLFGYYTQFPLLPVLLIGINIMTLIGIILLLHFKKIGFYIFVLSFIALIVLGVLYSDEIGYRPMFEAAFGLVFFLILMSFKNKETKLNGFQTLGLFPSRNKDEITESIQSTISNDNKNEDIVQESASSIINNIESTLNDKVFQGEIHEKRENDEINKSSFIRNNNKTEGEKDMHLTNKKEKEKNSVKKYLLPIFVLPIIILIGIYPFYIKEWRSDEKRFNDAKMLIESQQYEKGIEELEKIQDHFIPAKALLGQLYTLNDSVKRDMKRGEALLWEALEYNDTNACLSLSDIYIEKGDWEKSEELFNKAISIGLETGYRGLAYLYCVDEYGGVRNEHKNFKKAEFYALKIANNDSWSCNILGIIYYDGGDSVEQDYSKAFFWWNKGAKIGGERSSQCYSNLGNLYYNGFGIKQNYKKAYESYKKAISQDKENGYPYYLIATMFKNGHYVKYNRDSVRLYLQKAADLGEEDAAVELENDL